MLSQLDRPWDKTESKTDLFKLKSVNFFVVAFKKKLISVFSHRPRKELCFDVMGYWKVWAAILVACRRFRKRRFHHPRLRFVSRQEQLFLQSFGTLSISSFPFHFVPSENNFNTSSRKMANACTLQWKNRPCFDLPKNSVPRLDKAQYRNWHYGSARSWDLHMCHGKPRTGHILDWTTNEPQNMPRNIYDCFVLFFQFSHTENLVYKIHPNHTGKQVR